MDSENGVSREIATEDVSAVGTDNQVVFRSPYKCSISFQVVIGCNIVPFVVDAVRAFADHPRENVLPMMIALVFFVLAGLLLPIRLDVRSDGSIGMATLFVTWWYGDALYAYRMDDWVAGYDDGRRRRPMTFAACYEIQVCVKRPPGQIDLSVRPADPDGFVQAVNNVYWTARPCNL